jgi:hypothetical protein
MPGLCGIARANPVRNRLRLAPTERSHGRPRKRYSLKDGDVAIELSRKRTVGDMNDGPSWSGGALLVSGGNKSGKGEKETDQPNIFR